MFFHELVILPKFDKNPKKQSMFCPFDLAFSTTVEEEHANSDGFVCLR